jgi:hypothetical protein
MPGIRFPIWDLRDLIGGFLWRHSETADGRSSPLASVLIVTCISAVLWAAIAVLVMRLL